MVKRCFPLSALFFFHLDHISQLRGHTMPSDTTVRLRHLSSPVGAHVTAPTSASAPALSHGTRPWPRTGRCGGSQPGISHLRAAPVHRCPLIRLISGHPAAVGENVNLAQRRRQRPRRRRHTECGVLEGRECATLWDPPPGAAAGRRRC